MLCEVGFAFLTSAVYAAPQIAYRVNSQVPPVARVFEPYEFQFSLSTFGGGQGPLSYSISGSPGWLHLDNATRTFTGTPEPKDAGPTEFQLIARDHSGSSTMDVTFVTMQSAALELGLSILPQLALVGRTSAPNNLLLYPSQEFSFSLSKDTFKSPTSDLDYYATTDDDTPLPSWIHFDTANIRFSGAAPTLVSQTATAQRYGFKLIGSRVAGFSETSVVFHIAVGYHILAFRNASQTINIGEDRVVSISLKDQLQLDMRPARHSELIHAEASLPEWLDFSQQDLSISGTAPANVKNTEMTVSVVDNYGDAATTQITLRLPTLFVLALPVVPTTPGQAFKYTINSTLLATDDVKISANLANASSWLTYDEDDRTFQGTVPLSLPAGRIIIELLAQRESEVENASLELDVLPAPRPTHATSISTTTATSTSVSVQSRVATTTAISQGNHSTISNNRLRLILAIALPLILTALVSLLLLLYFWRRQRRKRKQHVESELESPNRQKAPKNPSPTPRDSLPEEPSSKPQSSNMTTPSDAGRKSRTVFPVPRLELPWNDSPTGPDDRPSRFSISAGLRNIGRSGRTSIISIANTPLIVREPRTALQTPSHPQNDRNSVTRQKPFNYSRKGQPFRPLSRISDVSGAVRRNSRPLSQISGTNLLLPTRRSGAGHGSGGPAGFNEVRRSWQNTLSSSTPSENSRIPSVELDSFPQPPLERLLHHDKENLYLGYGTSLRRVGSRSSSSYKDYLRERRRHRDQEHPARFVSLSSPKRFSTVQTPQAPLGNSPSQPSDPDYASGSDNWQYVYTSQPSEADQTSESWSLRQSPERRFGQETLRSNRRRPSTNHSTRYGSGKSMASSEWEDDDFPIESYDSDGRRRWFTSEALPDPPSRVGSLDIFRRGSHGRQAGRGHQPSSTDPFQASERSDEQAPGPSVSPRVREWKLGDDQGRRPVSVAEGNTLRSKGSQKGSLAFV